jgi:hypothetical protein
VEFSPRLRWEMAGPGHKDGDGEWKTWKKERTEHFPALAEALMVDGIYYVDDGMAVIVVFRPDGPDPALASEIPELEHGRRQGYLTSCVERKREVDGL